MAKTDPARKPGKTTGKTSKAKGSAPKPEQGAPAALSATGRDTRAGREQPAQAQAGQFLTTAQGNRLADSDHSLKAGPRGPVLLQDHHLREKLTHFDHERIPERAVHARGSAAHGVFRGYGAAGKVCKAGFLAEGVETPVFVRFSSVLGSRGSADTVRDTRGFATKFYTDEGVFDLVGNNIPVFFIQDAIKFPDVIHAGKPHPDREIPQAQSAHDTFWDFVSLHTEATHHTLWNMSDRGLPRSFRTMEGFGVHTFRLVNADGAGTLVKFHWKPRLGVHSLLWEEAQMIAGVDPDFHRRDLADAIEAGAYPEWELGIQAFPDTEEQMFEGIDLLDPTKLVPEELAPVQPIGLMTLNANPTDFFAETEQVAFHPGHVVPGIDVTDDPLLAGRLFSYLDTQLTRLGGPNFAQIPINRTHAPVNDMLRDGFHQDAVHTGVAPYKPNSLDGGCPFFAGADEHAYIEFPTPMPAARKVREAPASFADHYSQPRLLWHSLSPLEREHVIAAYTFELAKCYEKAIKERNLEILANIDIHLCEQVAAGLGLPAPKPREHGEAVEPSPALSQIGGSWPVTGRVVGIIAERLGTLPRATSRRVDHLHPKPDPNDTRYHCDGPLPSRRKKAIMTLMDEADNERAHAQNLAPGSVISVLLEQHAKIRDTFTAVQSASGPQRQQLFDELRELLAIHEAGEEMVLRPVSRKDASAQIADARNQEEDEAAHVLAELEKLDVDGHHFASKLAEFEKAVSDHASREETEEFPAVQAAHTDEELRGLGSKLLNAEHKAPTHPHPAAAGSPTAQRVVGPFAALLDKARDAHKN